MQQERPLLSMEGIDKRFPGVHALDQVDFDLREGEVHILLGENGAGKSTLMKILSGSLRCDSGRIFIHGKEIHGLNPEQAKQQGIGMVYQELSLVPALSVAENVFLGKMPVNEMRLIDWKKVHEKTKTILEDLGVTGISPKTIVRKLDVAEQQLVEIAKVLSAEPKILLLDEPTSAISDAERDRLFLIIERLKEKKVGIVYISHRLAEVPMIGQRVTVLRDGKVIGSLSVAEVDKDRLISMMVGRCLSEQYPKERVEFGDPLLQVENLSLEGRLEGISFELRSGQILGIFGLMGAGQEELTRTIFGLERKNSGRIILQGIEVNILSPSDAIRHGIGLLTRDRRESLLPALPIPQNISLARISQKRMYNFLKLKNEVSSAEEYIQSMRIQPPAIDRPVMFLSGGNQQKVALARWLFTKSAVLIFDEPTRGIDVGAKAEVFTLMNQLIEHGVGIIMVSSEMPEILAMADRILVMHDGKITAEYSAEEATQEKLLKSAS